MKMKINPVQVFGFGFDFYTFAVKQSMLEINNIF